MAVTNFIPTIWEARLLENYHNRSLADVITTAPTRMRYPEVTIRRTF